VVFLPGPDKLYVLALSANGRTRLGDIPAFDAALGGDVAACYAHPFFWAAFEVIGDSGGKN
jgi:hypothetical protein